MAAFDLPPDELRRLGRRVVELLVQAFDAERSEPVLREVDGVELRAALDEPLPRSPQGVDDILELFRERVAPYCRSNGHPRFFGYVCTSADPLGTLADALASAINQPVTAWRSAPAATEIERLVVRWLDQLTGFGAGGSGMLVSGGSAANFHGLACAVTAADAPRHRQGAYLSADGHVSMRKALQLLGVEHVRRIELDARRRIDLEALRAAIAADRETGLQPAVICGSAGTANTGAIDPLVELAELAAETGAWFHVDGSYGAPAVLTADYRWLAAAFARADSLSLDPHKWLFVPADAGCVLIRDETASRRTFALHSEYTAVTQTDEIERYAFFDHGLEMSRRFRGLKIWMVLKARGIDAIAAHIARDIELRQHLDARVAAEPDLEPLGSELSIACFRFLPADGEPVDEANRRILETLVRAGRCHMSPTTLDGRYALRACIVSFRTERSDVDFLVDEVLRVGRAR